MTLLAGTATKQHTWIIWIDSVNTQGEFSKPCVCAESTERSNFYPVTPHACVQQHTELRQPQGCHPAGPRLAGKPVGLPRRLHGLTAAPCQAAPGDNAGRKYSQAAGASPERATEVLLRSLRHRGSSRASPRLCQASGATAAHRQGQRCSSVPLHSSDTFSQILRLSFLIIFKAQL